MPCRTHFRLGQLPLEFEDFLAEVLEQVKDEKSLEKFKETVNASNDVGRDIDEYFGKQDLFYMFDLSNEYGAKAFEFIMNHDEVYEDSKKRLSYGKLIEEITEGTIETVQIPLAFCDINKEPDEGELPPFFWLYYVGYEDERMPEFIINHKDFNPNVQIKGGATPLLFSCIAASHHYFRGDADLKLEVTEATKLLLQHPKTDPDIGYNTFRYFDENRKDERSFVQRLMESIDPYEASELEKECFRLAVLHPKSNLLDEGYLCEKYFSPLDYALATGDNSLCKEIMDLFTERKQDLFSAVIHGSNTD